MKKASTAIALVTLLIAAPAVLQAQKSASPAASAPAAADLSKLGLAGTSQQAQAATASSNGEAPTPLQIVVQFLQLTPGQQQAFGELLQARQSVIPPILAQIQQLQQQLASLLSSGANPAAVGVVVIQINALQQQVVQHQQDFLSKFVSILDSDQQQLASLLSSSANPAAVGMVVIQINALQQQVVQHQQDFLSKFVSILDSDQQQRFQAIQLAAQLQPVLPAFAQLALI